MPASALIQKGIALESILEYIKLHGEQLDADVAAALGLPLEQVRAAVNELSAKGVVMTCFVTRYQQGRKVEGWSCRLAGFIPPAAPGRRQTPTKS